MSAAIIGPIKLMTNPIKTLTIASVIPILINTTLIAAANIVCIRNIGIVNLDKNVRTEFLLLSLNIDMNSETIDAHANSPRMKDTRAEVDPL